MKRISSGKYVNVGCLHLRAPNRNVFDYSDPFNYVTLGELL